MTKPPLLRLRFTNLVKKNATEGLLGKAAGFSFTPDIEAGWWDGNPHDPTAHAQLYPKVLKFTCEFSVIHEHHLGWHDCDGKWEVVCGEKGQPKFDENKMGWPYIPFGWSAGELLGQSPMSEDLSDSVIDSPIPSGRIDDVKEIDLGPYMKSDLGSQGASTSDRTKAKNAANPNPESQPAGQPEAEEEAEAQGQLGN